MALILAIVSACTVRPLYGSLPATDATSTSATGGLASIGINEPKTRYEQDVRNHLIFLLNGGVGEPSDPRYALTTGVISATVAAAYQQGVLGAPNERQPTAQTVVMTSSYFLTDNDTGKVVARGTRSISASFDRPQQEFAAVRAERDAQNRAARELAELLRIAILQDIERL